MHVCVTNAEFCFNPCAARSICIQFQLCFKENTISASNGWSSIINNSVKPWLILIILLQWRPSWNTNHFWTSQIFSSTHNVLSDLEMDRPAIQDTDHFFILKADQPRKQKKKFEMFNLNCYSLMGETAASTKVDQLWLDPLRGPALARSKRRISASWIH